MKSGAQARRLQHENGTGAKLFGAFLQDKALVDAAGVKLYTMKWRRFAGGGHDGLDARDAYRCEMLLGMFFGCGARRGFVQGWLGEARYIGTEDGSELIEFLAWVSSIGGGGRFLWDARRGVLFSVRRPLRSRRAAAPRRRVRVDVSGPRSGLGGRREIFSERRRDDRVAGGGYGRS